MKLLAIESSCDETAAAVIQDGRILSNVVASQIRLHTQYGGVVPELAAREHLANLVPVVQQSLAEAEIRADDLDWVSATQGPGLPPALMVGYQAAQHMAFALGIPLLGIQHHEAHLYSPWIDPEQKRLESEAFEPNLSLVVSGGHTLLLWVKSPMNHEVVGGTLDDAAGECFDKTAKLLGLPYPGGPLMDRLAAQGNPDAHRFPVRCSRMLALTSASVGSKQPCVIICRNIRNVCRMNTQYAMFVPRSSPPSSTYSLPRRSVQQKPMR